MLGHEERQRTALGRSLGCCLIQKIEKSSTAGHPGAGAR